MLINKLSTLMVLAACWSAGTVFAQSPSIEINWEAIEQAKQARADELQKRERKKAVREGDAESPPPQTAALSPAERAVFDRRLERVFFDDGTDSIRYATAETLQQIAGELMDNDVRLEISTYAPEAGEMGDARRLALSRARNLRDFLAALGIDERRITLRAMGPAQDGTDPNRADIKFIVP